MTQVTKQVDDGNSLPRCPISFTLDLLGDRWSLRLIRDMMLFGKQRYSEFLESCSGISTNILASRLKQLQANDLVEKFADPTDGKSSIYLLTDKGVSLYPILLETIRWGLEHDELSIVNEPVARELRAGNTDLRPQIEQRIARQRLELSRRA